MRIPRRLSKCLFPFVIAFLLLPTSSHAVAPFVDKEWTVVAYFGEGIFVNPDDFIGKKQNFYKGWIEGHLFNCKFQGSYSTYHSYTKSEFLAAEEFSLFKKFERQLTMIKDRVFVHRMSCAGNRTQLYPFITFGPLEKDLFKGKALFLFEAAIYVLE